MEEEHGNPQTPDYTGCHEEGRQVEHDNGNRGIAALSATYAAIENTHRALSDSTMLQPSNLGDVNRKKFRKPFRAMTSLAGLKQSFLCDAVLRVGWSKRFLTGSWFNSVFARNTRTPDQKFELRHTSL
ncbi:hypothetical protein RRG08_002046 [Elysia crispata]|uniref:Uncharacterized protein n=1 Tax=Elysia crispata TaxID=231223 RepID=A0AAE0ZM47_9GAST|nr:hypothetical protein RRG08_002046 [Elysia crispata]